MMKRELVPEGWKRLEIGLFTKLENVKNAQASIKDVVSVTKYKGIVDSLEYFNKQIYSKNISTYKIIKRNQFAYSTIHLDEGAIGFLNHKEVAVLSPMYTVFSIEENKIDKEFLYNVLKSDEFMNVYKHAGSGSVNRRKSISFETFKKIKISLPPFYEQKKIIKILNSVDSAIDSTRQEIDQIVQFKRAMTEEFLIQMKQNISVFGDLCESSAFGPRFSSKFYDVDGNIATLRTTDLDSDGNINYSTMPLAKLETSKYKEHFIKKGDILISRSGTCGVTAVFEDFYIPVMPAAFCIRFRLSNKVNPYYIKYYFNSSFGKNQVKAISKGAVQQNITGTSLKNLLIILPSRTEQDRMVDIVNSINSYKEATTLKLNQLLSIKSALINVLLTGEKRVKLDHKNNILTTLV